MECMAEGACMGTHGELVHTNSATSVRCTEERRCITREHEECMVRCKRSAWGVHGECIWSAWGCMAARRTMRMAPEATVEGGTCQQPPYGYALLIW